MSKVQPDVVVFPRLGTIYFRYSTPGDYPWQGRTIQRGQQLSSNLSDKQVHQMLGVFSDAWTYKRPPAYVE